MTSSKNNPGKFDWNTFKNSLKDRKKILKTSGAYLAGIIAVTAILVVVDLASDQRIYPRVYAGPVELGYVKSNEALMLLTQKTDAFVDTPITFKLANKEVTLTPKELGITYSNQRVINNLPTYHFSASKTLSLVLGLIKAKHFALAYAIDGEKAIKALEQKLEIQNLRAKNARFVYKNKTLQIEPEVNGTIIDRPELLRALDNNVKNLKNEPIELNTIPEVASIATGHLAQAKDRFQQAISSPMYLLYDGHRWKIDPKLHTDAITYTDEKVLEFKKFGWAIPVILDHESVGENDDFRLKTSPRIVFINQQIWPFLSKNIVASVNKLTEDVKIYKNDKAEIVIDGRGENGLSVQSAKLVASMNLALNTGIKNVSLPVYEEKAKVEIAADMQAMGIKEIIATGYTTYYGSPTNRIRNINVGIKKFNGLVVKPGEVFSFNEYLGPVDGSTGFFPEKVIKGNKAVVEYGGGICQVSTTLYRALLYAGVPIVERWPHTWKITYYAQVLGDGIDATIYPGNKDLRFLNDTGANILIQSYSEGSRAYFKLYGTSDGRKVALDGPHGGGMDYTWYRTITKDGQAKIEKIFSKYTPMPKVDPNAAPVPDATDSGTAPAGTSSTKPEAGSGTNAGTSKPTVQPSPATKPAQKS